MLPDPIGASIPGVKHHHVSVNDTDLHYVSAGASGSPVLLVHGFPETWWVFHKLIPLLSEHHRVFAVDLRGFGDSREATDGHDSLTAATDLVELITHLDLGPVHLTGQDVSGPTTYRVAATHAELVKSFTAIPDAFTSEDIDELARSFSRPEAFRGATGLYRSLLGDADEIRRLAAHPLEMPVLAVGGGSGEFTPTTMRHVATDVHTLSLEGIGHYAAMEAPHRLADGLLAFYKDIDLPQGLE